ncbi:MAG: stage III sporulation protein AD [Clostridiales bacterium]|nr:stage III sporulation protein AD [Clostridiales bacterium]
MEIIRIVGVALTAAALALLLRQQKPEYALALSLVVTVGIFSVILPPLRETLEMIYRVADQTGASGPAVTIVKSLGIAFVAGIGADTCRDAGEEAMAAKVELAGRVAILAVALPMAARLMGLFQEILA